MQKRKLTAAQFAQKKNQVPAPVAQESDFAPENLAITDWEKRKHRTKEELAKRHAAGEFLTAAETLKLFGREKDSTQGKCLDAIQRKEFFDKRANAFLGRKQNA